MTVTVGNNDPKLKNFMFNSTRECSCLVMGPNIYL